MRWWDRILLVLGLKRKEQDPAMVFFEIVSKIMTAALLGQAACRGYFDDPTGFDLRSHQHNGIRKPCEKAYRLLF